MADAKPAPTHAAAVEELHRAYRQLLRAAEKVMRAQHVVVPMPPAPPPVDKDGKLG